MANPRGEVAEGTTVRQERTTPGNERNAFHNELNNHSEQLTPRAYTQMIASAQGDRNKAIASLPQLELVGASDSNARKAEKLGGRPASTRADEKPDGKGERVVEGANRQKVHFDARDQVTEINYPNGMTVKLKRDANGQINRADITGAGSSMDGSLVRNGDKFDRIDSSGRATSEKVTSFDIRKDGSAVIHGQSDLLGTVIKGKRTVSGDGKVVTTME